MTRTFITRDRLADIKASLSRKPRAWHTYDKHIKPMMRQAALDREHLYDFTVVYLSILYHDIVYSTDVTYHHFNEKQSTQIFSEDWVTLNISNDQFFAVQSFILATISHKVDNISHSLPESYHNDLKYFLDLDILIFAQPFIKVLEFDSLIREEFSHIDDRAYYPARLEIIKKFAERPAIYVSDRFKHLNPVAKDNLEKLSVLLSLHV